MSSAGSQQVLKSCRQRMGFLPTCASCRWAKWTGSSLSEPVSASSRLTRSQRLRTQLQGTTWPARWTELMEGRAHRVPGPAQHPDKGATNAGQARHLWSLLRHVEVPPASPPERGGRASETPDEWAGEFRGDRSLERDACRPVKASSERGLSYNKPCSLSAATLSRSEKGWPSARRRY